MNEPRQLFTAKVVSDYQRGEPVYSGSVWMGPMRVFSTPERPTQQGACLDILDWALRHGKNADLNWCYVVTGKCRSLEQAQEYVASFRRLKTNLGAVHS